MGTKITLLGLGIMGGGMARRLLDQGQQLAVYNRNADVSKPFAELGARVAATPQEAAADADVIISMLADDNASRQVWLGDKGAIHAAKPGSIFVEASTVSPAWTVELSKSAETKNCSLLDAPVTGTKPHAENGELSFLVGGSQEALEKARPVLEILGRRILHLGPVGNGARMKLINNFMCSVQAAALAEGLVLAERCGLPHDVVADILTNGAPGSPLVKTLAQRIAAHQYEPNFVLRLMEKDIGYAMDLGQQNHLELRTAAAARELFKDALETEWAEKDFSAVIEPLRARS